MKSLTTLSILAGLSAFGSTAFGSTAFGVAPTVSADSVSSLPRAAADLERLEGQIGTIADGAFDLMVGGVRHSVRIDEQTAFRLDGKEATRAQVLVEGRHAAVELDRGRATSVDAKSSGAVALPETVKGKIRSVGEESFVLMVDDEAQTIQIDANTKYLLDDKEARKGQVLVADKQVSVEVTDGTATKVSARSSALAAPLETMKGKIRSVGEESFVLMVDGEAQTIQIDADTKYWLDDKEARKGQVLVADKQVSVEVTDGTATKVSARSAD